MAEDERITITRERAETLLAAYGGAPEAWPEDERAALQAALDGSAELRRLRDEARRLDRAIGSRAAAAPAAAPSPGLGGLAGRILSQLPPQEAADRAPPAPVRESGLGRGWRGGALGARVSRWRRAARGRRLAWSAALAAAAAAALVIAVTPEAPPPESETSLAASPALDDGSWDALWARRAVADGLGPLEVAAYLEPDLAADEFWIVDANWRYTVE